MSLTLHDTKTAKQEEQVVVKEDKVFQYVIEILEVLANQRPGPALQLYLQSALCADRCDMEKIVYELLSQVIRSFTTSALTLSIGIHAL